MPLERKKPVRALVNVGTPSAEALRTLRLALQLRSESRTGNTILFTSAEPGVGKSTVAANYALVASVGQRVLLVDGDLRRPSLHSFFEMPQEPGLIELLAGDSDLAVVARRVPGLGQLRLLTAGKPIPHSADVASSERMRDILRRASADYDLVVIDTAPILGAADAEGMASHPGVAVVLVVRPTTKRRALTKALRRLELIEANIAGVVVNRAGRVESYSNY
jgi:tyrosine-protein kinase Etk/Wzc